VLKLRRAPGLVVEPPALDEVQQAVVDHRGSVLRVLGGPGTGKTTTAVEVVVDRVERDGLAPDQCLLLTSSRVAAGELRQRVTARLGRTSTEPLARTHQAFGFGILRQAAALRGDPAPRLLSGPEQDVILRELLAGHASGETPGPQWPQRVREALPTKGFRAELRDLLMRAVEHDLEPADLRRLGERHDRPEWVAAADVLEEYDEVTALSAPGAYDPAWILGSAADLLEEEPEAMARVRDGLRLVVVDDAQELTAAAVRLLRTVLAPGIDLVLLGDPDTAVQTFRGADPRHLAGGWPEVDAATTIVLPKAHRLPGAVAEAAARVTPKIGALAGGVQRRADPGRPGGAVDVMLLRAVNQEAAAIAARLRAAHLRDGVPWSEMAVVVRGKGRTATLRRVLMAAGVPVAGAATDLPVRDEVAVRPLLALLRAALELAQGEREVLDPQVAVDALTSPIGGADAVSLRRLRRGLRRQELDNGGGRPSDELLAEALVQPGHLLELGVEANSARRVAAVLHAGREAARVDREGGRRWAPGVSAESVLWAMWSATGLAREWRTTALSGGHGAARADRDLDAVVGLFDAAATFVDRLPQAGPEEFLTHVESQDIPGDTLVARSPVGEAVTVLTPQAAAGREWRFVVVAGVQEGVWPDLRLRGSLLGSEELVSIVSGRPTTYRGAQAAVRYDETRLFLVALTRARESVLVTAVRSDDEQPSVYLDVVDPEPARVLDDGSRDFDAVPQTLTLPAVVAQQRRLLVSRDPKVRERATAALARLACERVEGADPADWWVMRELSDDRPLRANDELVRVSPSRVDNFQKCGLKWLLTSVGGDGPSVGAADVGTLVHQIAHELGDAPAAELAAEVDARWGRLGMPAGWISDRKRGEARTMVERLAAYFGLAADKGWVKVGAEVDMRVVIGRAEVRGSVDRLERLPDGRLRIVDYKTGSSRPSRAEVPSHPQLGVYQLGVDAGALPEYGAESGGAALLQLGAAANKGVTLDEQGPLKGSDDPQWAADLVARTAEGMAGATFLAQVNDLCSMCPVRSCCPAWPEGRVL
jgi:superfamily I DNA/RNA helicase/RecB family exonuclease